MSFLLVFNFHKQILVLINENYEPANFFLMNTVLEKLL